MTRKGCLDRPTLRAVAAGRCPKERLPAVPRNLAKCSRCRAAVISAAAGVRGPGETVVLKRPRRVVGRISKALVVAASMTAAGAAWRRTVASKPPELTTRASLQPQSVLEVPGAETPHPSTVASPETPTVVQDPATEKPLERQIAPADSKPELTMVGVASAAGCGGHTSRRSGAGIAGDFTRYAKPPRP